MCWAHRTANGSGGQRWSVRARSAGVTFRSPERTSVQTGRAARRPRDRALRKVALNRRKLNVQSCVIRDRRRRICSRHRITRRHVSDGTDEQGRHGKDDEGEASPNHEEDGRRQDGKVLRRSAQGPERLLRGSRHNLRRNEHGRLPGQCVQARTQGHLRDDEHAEGPGKSRAEGLSTSGRAATACPNPFGGRRGVSVVILRRSHTGARGRRSQGRALPDNHRCIARRWLLRSSRRELHGRGRSAAPLFVGDSGALSLVAAWRRIVDRRGPAARQGSYRAPEATDPALQARAVFRASGVVFARRRLPQRSAGGAVHGETLNRVVEHIDQLQTALGCQMLLENPSTYIAFAESTYAETDFIAEVARRTGCGLLLDVNNVFVASTNQQWDPVAYIQGYPLARVREIHLAGNAREVDEAARPLLIDTHDRPVEAAVWDLFALAVRLTGPVPTLIEWDTQVPAWSMLAREAERAETIMYANQSGI